MTKKKEDLRTVKKGKVIADRNRTQYTWEFKRSQNKWILEIQEHKHETGTKVEEEVRSVRSNVTEYRPVTDQDPSKMTVAQKKKYDKEVEQLNKSIQGGLVKVIDNKVNNQAVEPVVMEKNVQQLVKVEKEVTTWIPGSKKSFDVFVDLSHPAIRIWVKNYAKTK